MAIQVLERTQVGAVLDLENLLHAARRTSGTVVRAQFSAIVEELRSLGEIRSGVGCCDRWLAKILVPVAVRSGIRIFPASSARTAPTVSCCGGRRTLLTPWGRSSSAVATERSRRLSPSRHSPAAAPS